MYVCVRIFSSSVSQDTCQCLSNIVYIPVEKNNAIP